MEWSDGSEDVGWCKLKHCGDRNINQMLNAAATIRIFAYPT